MLTFEDYKSILDDLLCFKSNVDDYIDYLKDVLEEIDGRITAFEISFECLRGENDV